MWNPCLSYREILAVYRGEVDLEVSRHSSWLCNLLDFFLGSHCAFLGDLRVSTSAGEMLQHSLINNTMPKRESTKHGCRLSHWSPAARRITLGRSTMLGSLPEIRISDGFRPSFCPFANIWRNLQSICFSVKVEYRLKRVNLNSNSTAGVDKRKSKIQRRGEVSCDG